MSAPFQVMPALTDDEFQELRDDIAANGITVPVVVDQHGRVIDGHHRLQIAGLLGIDPADVPRVVREVVNAQEARSLAYSLNLHRRHLDREARRALLAASIKADPGLSDRQHAGRAGVSDKTATAVRRDLESTAEIPQLTKRTGADGKQRTMPAPRHVDTTTGEITETAGAGEAPTRAGFTEDTPPAPATVTGLDGKTYTRPAPRPRAVPDVPAEYANPEPSYMTRFFEALAADGKALRFDPERVGREATEIEWPSVVAMRRYAEWVDRAERARKGLRVIKGSAR